MIEEQAIVVDVSGQAISVETDSESNCGHCSAKSGCGTSLLGKFFSRNRQQLIVETDLSLVVGDKVVLGLNSDALLQGSVIVYAIPLVMMLALPMAMSYFYASELVSIFSGIIGLASGLIYVKYFSAIAHSSERFRPIVLRRVD
ncbi:MAG: SoxR reducing system RseC family protein [Sulfuriflexus sp.]|nr:SoxR reducing system RseC family protein [Sulfuriflexus sp.]